MSRNWEPRLPAIEFEREHRLSGIAGDYKFPNDPGFDRIAIQHKVWVHYDTLTDPQILSERINQFATSLKKPAITLREIQANKNLGSVFANFVRKHEFDELTIIFKKLEHLNYEDLSKITFNSSDIKQLSDVVHGIVSGFNCDDINHYIRRFDSFTCLNELERTAPEMERRVLESRILQKLGKANNHTIGWIASHKTLEKIWEQVKGRPVQILEEGITKAVNAPYRI